MDLDRERRRSGPGDPVRVAPAADPLEHEADAAADRVAAGRPVGSLSLAAGAVSRAVAGAAAPEDGGADRLDGALRQGGGAGLPGRVQRKLESSFGADLGGVRVHAGAASAAAAGQIGADAFTSGQDVHFAAGRYQPGTPAGDRLIAHEVAHTLQQRSGGALQRRAVQARLVQAQKAGETPAPPGDGAAATTEAQLEALIRKIENAYFWIAMKQKDAVQRLHTIAEKETPPSLAEQLLIAAAQVALAAAMGGVGGLIAAALVKQGASLATKAIAAAVVDGTKDAGKRLVAGAVSQAAAEGKSSADTYFFSQEDSLLNLGKKQQDEFIDEEAGLRAAPNGLEEARKLHASIEENYEKAAATQEKETLDGWCVYLAQEQLGTTKDGGTDLKGQLRDTSARGVLGIVIDVEQPGDTPTIVRAEIEGLYAGKGGEDKGLLAKIERQPIKELRIPITVKGEVGRKLSWAQKYIGKEYQPTIRIGRSETGTVTVDFTVMHGAEWWLQKRGGAPEASVWASTPDAAAKRQAADRAYAFKGARALIEEDLGNLKVAGKLSD